MKYYELDNEEKQILVDFDGGGFRPTKGQVTLKKELIAAARETLSKTKNVNLRLSQKTLSKLKAKAMASGVPYQTLAASIIHQSVVSKVNGL